MRVCALLLVWLLSSLSFHARAGEAAQEEWYVWAPDEVRLYVLQVGHAEAQGSPIVVLHGGVGAEHSYLLPAFLPLADRHRFTFFDQRGSLRSPARPEAIRFEAMVSDIDAIRNELGAERIRLVGHSMGALLSYAYLRQHPDRVDNLTVIGPAFPFYPGASPEKALFDGLGIPTDDEAWMAEVAAPYHAFGKEAEARAEAMIRAQGLDREGLSGREATDAWRIRFAAHNIHQLQKWRQMIGGQAFYNGDVYAALVENAGGQPGWASHWAGLFEALRQFPRKSTFIVGKRDFIDPAFRFWPVIVARIPNATLVGLDDAGHNAWVDQPEAFAQALEAALAPEQR